MTEMNTAVKTLDAHQGRVGGYLVVWGATDKRDLQGEFFTQETDFALDWFEVRPMLYQHGLDGDLKAAVIGRIDHLQADETGIWAEAQLDTHKRYVQAVQRLIDKGILHWSSGSLGHLVEVAASGQIKRWPLIEGSLTPTPAEPRRTDVAHIKAAYDTLGLDSTRLSTSADNTDTNPSHAPHHPTTINTTKGQPMTQPTKQLPLQSQADAAPQIVVSSEFDRYDATDMLHGYMLLRTAKSFQGVSERYANALSHKIQGAGLTGIKADELSYSTQTGFGDEWVPEMWSQQIWNKARQDNVVLPLFRSIEMPSNPFDLPIEGTDPTVYYVPQTTREIQLVLTGNNPIPDSKIGSGQVQLSAKKLALRVGFSNELVEDSIVPVLNIYREQAMRAIANSIDYVLLNGDTDSSATGNINSDDAAPTSTDRYLAFNGLRKLPLVTNTTNAIDMSNSAPTLAKMRETRFAMQMRYSARPTDLAWIVDGNTYAQLLGLSEFLTMDKAGPMATAQTGQIGFIDGIPVFVSAEMPLTVADGKVDDAGSNDRGTALCVYRPGWFVGYRRRVAVNVDYIPYYDSYQMTATVRLAFANYDTDVASLLYNIAV